MAVLGCVSVIGGFVRSRRERDADRQHFAAFVGFSAALIAAPLMVVHIAIPLGLGPIRFRYIGSIAGDLIAISAIAQHLSTLVAFFAGLFSGGIWRVFLVLFGPVMLLMSVLLAFSNFGA